MALGCLPLARQESAGFQATQDFLDLAVFRESADFLESAATRVLAAYQVPTIRTKQTPEVRAEIQAQENCFGITAPKQMQLKSMSITSRMAGLILTSFWPCLLIPKPLQFKMLPTVPISKSGQLTEHRQTQEIIGHFRVP